ncbi:MAG: hypothetical protein KGH71_00385 [Candidatus Micrarchaeota archaeon]|nr:hypothetical protein [Candidatus Micrarchaeota archaeon]
MSRVIVERQKISVDAVLGKLRRGEYSKKEKLGTFHSDFSRIDCEVGESSKFSRNLSDIKLPEGSVIPKSMMLDLMTIEILRSGQKKLPVAMDKDYEDNLVRSIIRGEGEELLKN